MLQKISEQIAKCLAEAEHMRRHAENQTDPELRAEWLELERSWLKLAESIRFVEQADRFLDDAAKSRPKR